MHGTIGHAMAALRRRWWVLAVVVAGQFMFVMDVFIVNVAIPSIRSDLHAGAGEMQAVLAAYQVAYASLVVTGGRLGDILGRRRVFVGGVLGFTAASLWCGAAGSGLELVLARLVQGGAAALMVPQVLATIHELFPANAVPDGARARAFAAYGIALGLGGAIGFALGGWLVELDLGGLGWRCVFLVNLPIGLVIAVAAWRLMPPGLMQGNVRQPAAQLDIAGAALLFLGLACLIGPLLAGHELGWPLWLWAMVAVAVGVLALLPRFERRVARHGGMPLVDLALLGDRLFRRGLGAAFAFQFANISYYLVITLFLQGRLGFSPLQSGLAAVPLALAFSIASQLAGRWTARFGTHVLRWGCLVQLAGIGALGVVLALPQPGAPEIVAALALFGFGQGLVMAPLFGLVMANVGPAHAGSGAGMLNTVNQAAGGIGVSAVGTLYAMDGIAAALAALALAIAVCRMLLGRMRPTEG